MRITHKPELDTAHPGKWVADITITYDDGTSESVFVDSPRGTAENPISQPDLDAKFRDLTATSMGSERSEELLRAITDGDLTMTASELVDLLVI
ncbi:hypothetical protein [Streptomyces sp. NPDC058385]|uniref:hypothetical protein n=1 Tax=Streptomyces sp. NPDC058385 TaxID=3346473 RepID=UPI003659924A